MRILVACEFSGIVRDAFIRRGHNAYSCDTEPSEGKFRNNHRQCDVRTLLKEQWDMLIAFPPCTFLCNSGVRWLVTNGKINGKRFAQMIIACEFFNALLGEGVLNYQGIPKVVAENPIQHKYARERIRKYDQIIQPWQFGHGEIKATCLWLRNLPLLKATKIVEGREPRVHHASPGLDRWKERSRTLTGIANAMAEQWG